MTTCWGPFLSFFTYTLKPYLNADDEYVPRSGRKLKPIDDHILIGIECLQLATKLCVLLELHDRTGSVLAPLTSIICRGGGHIQSAKRMPLAYWLQLECILVNGLELGSQSQDCWKHIMR